MWLQSHFVIQLGFVMLDHRFHAALLGKVPEDLVGSATESVD